jgi:hypothetical protein
MPSKVKNYLIILLALATVTSGLIAFSQSRRLAALEADLLKASAAAAAVKPRSAPVAAEFAARPAAQPAIPAEVDPAAPTAGEAPAARENRGNNRANFATLMADPEFAKAMTVQQRAALDARYADLFKKLNLPPDQLEKFKSLLVERQTARMDVMVAARENGIDPRENRDELRKMTAEAQSEVDAAIKTALGESVYNAYQNFDNTQNQRALVKQLDTRLGYTSTALSSTQSDFLVNALAASATTTDQGGGGPGNWGGGGARATITDEVVQQARSVLTPDQVSALMQLQIEQQAQQKIREMMRPQNQNGGNNR